MTPEISEFSYGFALTNEIVGWLPLRAAPVFPSLIEEGKAGGGYDVKLDAPGIPLYLQFKRADCLLRKSAVEIRDHNLPLSFPFYRFKITESGKSDQHDMLLALDDGSCVVMYAAPRFHQLVEINHAWGNNQVASRSIFVKPSVIGTLDAKSHHVAYDYASAHLCSEPRSIEFLDSGGLAERLSTQLAADTRPLVEKIPELVRNIEEAGSRARSARAARSRRDRIGIGKDEIVGARRAADIDAVPRSLLLSEQVPTRQPRDLPETDRKLRDLSDIAARLFNVQLIVVQPPVST